MNGRNYVPFKTKKSASIVSTTDSLLSELSCSTQVIGQVGSNGQLSKKKYSSTQRLNNDRTDQYRSHGKLNGAMGIQQGLYSNHHIIISSSTQKETVQYKYEQCK
jgi:hypothetical protein